MRKRFAAAIVALAILAVAFGGLWLFEKNDHSEMEMLCQTNASQALSDFKQYKTTGAEGDYWYGVSNYKAFMNTWLAIEGQSSAEYSWCNSVYGSMVLMPEKVQVHIDELLAAMEIIGDDYTDPNGYIKISELNNLLRHG